MAKPVITVEVLKNENDLWALENAFLKAVGEEPMSMEKLWHARWMKKRSLSLPREWGRSSLACALSANAFRHLPAKTAAYSMISSLCPNTVETVLRACLSMLRSGGAKNRITPA